MIIHQRIVSVFVLVVALLLITLDYYYSEKINQKDVEIKLNSQLLVPDRSTSEKHHEDDSSPCGM